MSRVEIAKNRRDIMDVIKCIQKFDDKIFKLEQDSAKNFRRLEQFLISYMQFCLIIDEIKIMSLNAMSYLNNLKIELNSLAVNQLSINTISPIDLKNVLSDIQSRSPNNFKLPVNPENDMFIKSCLV